MPDKDGLETILALRKKSPGLKIIVMSGGGRNSASRYFHLAHVMGAWPLLAKLFYL